MMLQSVVSCRDVDAGQCRRQAGDGSTIPVHTSAAMVHARAWHRHKQDNLKSRQIKLIILGPFLWSLDSLAVY